MKIRADEFHGEVERRMKRLTAGETRAATVLVKHGSHILMGRRLDSGKWTLPGGHLDDGEAPEAGAIRELEEEAGFKASSLKAMGTHKLTGKDARPLTVHTFTLEAPSQFTATSKADPDNEVMGWQWINVEGGLPRDVASNLQHSPNHALADAGLA